MKEKEIRGGNGQEEREREGEGEEERESERQTYAEAHVKGIGELLLCHEASERMELREDDKKLKKR